MLSAEKTEKEPLGFPNSDNAWNEYSGYEEWKRWANYFEFTQEEAEYYAGELAGIPMDGKAVLEIGFGSGSFLAWARGRGARIAGTELNARALDEARRFGVELLEPEIEKIADRYAGRFDLVVAFDVFEHFELAESRARLKAVETMLTDGGHLVLRFPNGQSPFGLAPQNGDVTHRAALSREKLEQLSQGTKLRTVRYGGAFAIRGPWGLKRVVRAGRRLGQWLIGAGLNAVFAQKIPWQAVVVLIMQKAERSASLSRSER